MTQIYIKRKTQTGMFRTISRLFKVSKEEAEDMMNDFVAQGFILIYKNFYLLQGNMEDMI